MYAVGTREKDGVEGCVLINGEIIYSIARNGVRICRDPKA